MKTQILIEDGVAQIALTPETDFEKVILAQIPTDASASVTKRGTFALCRGGYYREFDERPNHESLIVVLAPTPSPEDSAEDRT